MSGNGQSQVDGAEIRPGTTASELSAALKSLGVQSGDTVMVHSSCKSFGGFAGGVPEIIRVLQEAVTQAGIVAMPAFTDCADGGTTSDFNAATTPVEKWVGIIPEIFRLTPGVLRSSHPTHSVCAWGNKAESFLRQADPDDCFAPDGPWGKLAKGGKILFWAKRSTATPLSTPAKRGSITICTPSRRLSAAKSGA